MLRDIVCVLAWVYLQLYVNYWWNYMRNSRI